MADGRRVKRSIGFYRDLNEFNTAWPAKVKKRRPIYKELYTVEEILGSRYNKVSNCYSLVCKTKLLDDSYSYHFTNDRV